jgi:hypothetical protein
MLINFPVTGLRSGGRELDKRLFFGPLGVKRSKTIFQHRTKHAQELKSVWHTSESSTMYNNNNNNNNNNDNNSNNNNNNNSNYTFPVRRLGVYRDHLVNRFCPGHHIRHKSSAFVPDSARVALPSTLPAPRGSGLQTSHALPLYASRPEFASSPSPLHASPSCVPVEKHITIFGLSPVPSGWDYGKYCATQHDNHRPAGWDKFHKLLTPTTHFKEIIIH